MSRFLASVLVFAAACIAGCGGSGVSGVRLINTSPGNASLDAFSSDQQIASAVTYGMASSYTQVDAGSHTISLAANGNDAKPLYQLSQDFLDQSQYTVFAINPGTGIGELFLLDSNLEPDAGDFELRLVNVSPSNSVVDAYVTAPSVPITSVPATVRNLAYGTANPYLQLAAGSYEVRFTLPGTKTVIADTAAFTPAAGDIDTVAAADSPAGGAPYQAYQYTDAQYSNNNSTSGGQ